MQQQRRPSEWMLSLVLSSTVSRTGKGKVHWADWKHPGINWCTRQWHWVIFWRALVYMLGFTRVFVWTFSPHLLWKTIHNGSSISTAPESNGVLSITSKSHLPSGARCAGVIYHVPVNLLACFHQAHRPCISGVPQKLKSSLAWYLKWLESLSRYLICDTRRSRLLGCVGHACLRVQINGWQLISVRWRHSFFFFSFFF